MILQRTRKYFSIFPAEPPYLLIGQQSVLPLEIRQREEEGRQGFLFGQALFFFNPSLGRSILPRD